MRCNRCDGLMVVEHCLDLKGNKDDFWIQAMRCVMCGNLQDSMIARHQVFGPPEIIPAAKQGIRRAPRTPVARLSA